QAEDGIRDFHVTGVQTCALPIWFGIGAPSKTPPAIVGLLNKEIRAGLADPAIKKRLSDLGGTIFASSPAEFKKFVAAETEKWAKIGRAASRERRKRGRGRVGV